MTKKEYFQFASEFFKECLAISEKKNADYTGKDTDPFSNFESVNVLGISTEHGFLTRMMDKIKRIASFVEKGELQVKDENVTDTLHDLCNYSCLLAGYIKSKNTFARSNKDVISAIPLLDPRDFYTKPTRKIPKADLKYFDKNRK